MINFHSRIARKRKGLTLLELLVVIVILAVISAIAIPTFLSVINQSKVRTAEVTAAAIQHDAWDIATANGQSAPTAQDYSQAVAETDTTAAGTGVLAAGSGVNLGGKLAFTLTTDTVPFVASHSYGVVSAAPPDTVSSAPTGSGVAFMSGVSGTAVFAHSTSAGSITTWAENCTVATSLVAAADLQSRCTIATAPSAPSGVTAKVTTTSHTTTVGLPPTSTTGYEITWSGGSLFVPAGTFHATVSTTAPVTVVTVSKSSGTSQPAGSGSGGVTTVSTAPATSTTSAPVVDYTCGSTVTVTWKPPATNGSSISSYTVQSTTGGLSTTVGGSTTTAKFYTLSTGKSFAFKVDASNAAGTGPWSAASNTVTITASCSLSNVTDASAGGNFSCAVGGGHAWCWGTNKYGQLGDGSNVSSDTPVRVSGLSDVVQIATSGTDSCAVTSAGNAYCWGYGTSKLSPTLMDITNVTHVSVFHGSVCFDASGKARCGGITSARFYGLDEEAIAVSAGSSFDCALTSAGTVICTGYLADTGGSRSGTVANDVGSPKTVPAAHGAAQLMVSYGGACVLLNGYVECWTTGTVSGSTWTVNLVQRSGIGNSVEFSAAGLGNGCAVSDSHAYCWGTNYYGQLGNGNTSSSDVPVAVTGISNVSSVSTGTTSACAVATGHAWCWGRNTFGQLGNNSATSSSTPVEVSA